MVMKTKKIKNGLLLRPETKEIKACLLWIHGGGYITGFASMVHMSRAKNLVEKFGVLVLSPEYRILPYPIPLEDCIESLKYLYEIAQSLQVPLFVGGESAGGGLCVACCLYARDHLNIKIDYQFPLYPMISHLDTPSSKDNHALVWNTYWNHRGWKYYLSDCKDKVSKYASPSLETDYSSLPPAYTFVSEKEPFYCETLDYIAALQKAGIKAHVDIYPNYFHAFDMLLPKVKQSKKAIEKFENEFEKILQQFNK